MNTILILYALTVTGRLIPLLITFGIISFVVIIMRWVIFGFQHDVNSSKDVLQQKTQKVVQFTKRTIAIPILLFLTACLLPDRNDLVFILGGNAVIQAIDSDKSKVLGDKTLTMVEKWLDEHTKQDTPAK
jgi:hypothetical protein